MPFIGAIFYYLNQFIRRALCSWLNFTAKRRAHYFGDGSKFINGGGRVYGWDNITIGDNVKIMDGCFFNCRHGKLFIGNNTIISRDCTIYTWNHEYEGERLPFDPDKSRPKYVVIDENVWIGMNVEILPGTLIGKGAIIGAGCVVAGFVAAGAIVGAPLGVERKRRLTS